MISLMRHRHGDRGMSTTKKSIVLFLSSLAPRFMSRGFWLSDQSRCRGRLGPPMFRKKFEKIPSSSTSIVRSGHGGGRETFELEGTSDDTPPIDHLVMREFVSRLSKYCLAIRRVRGLMVWHAARAHSESVTFAPIRNFYLTPIRHIRVYICV